MYDIMVDVLIVTYFGAIVVLYMALGITFMNRFIRTRDMSTLTCGDTCSLIKLTTSGNCTLKCTSTPKCECYQWTPTIPGACFLYRDCDVDSFVESTTAKRYIFGTNEL
jgi:hypothetical protein